MLVRSSRLSLHTCAALVLGCAALAALPALARADLTIVVNTTADQAPSVGECSGTPGDCSLRQAIDKANATPGTDTVKLGSGRYELTIPGNGEDEGKTGDLDVIEGALRVEGTGARNSVVAASPGLADRVFDALPGTELTLVGLAVTGGDVSNESGGGIRTQEATLTLIGAAVTDNTARNSGSGGGIAASESKTTIVASLIARNLNSGDGGGIYADGELLAIENSTIANNRVDTSLYPGNPGWGAYGGGMEIDLEKFAMRNVTISGNSIHDGNGGTKNEGQSPAIEGGSESSEIVNTIVWGNTGTQVETTYPCSDTFPSLGHNVEPPSPEHPCFTGPAIVTTDPLLGPLANNGGETDTMALLLGSSAIDTGLPAQCPAADQRGVTRPQLGACDIGAFEFTPAPPPPPLPAKPAIARKGKVVVKASGKRFKAWPGVRVSCPAAGPRCTGTLIAKAKLGGAAASAAKAVRIGKAKFGLAPGKSKALSVKLSRKASLRLVDAGKLRVGFTVSSQAGGSGLAKKAFKVTLKAPKPKP